MRFWKGKSPSVGDVGIGIGAEIVPRMDLCRDLARPRVDPDFPNRLGMMNRYEDSRRRIISNQIPRKGLGRGTKSKSKKSGQRRLIKLLLSTPGHLGNRRRASRGSCFSGVARCVDDPGLLLQSMSALCVMLGFASPGDGRLSLSCSLWWCRPTSQAACCWLRQIAVGVEDMPVTRNIAHPGFSVGWAPMTDWKDGRVEG